MKLFFNAILEILFILACLALLLYPIVTFIVWDGSWPVRFVWWLGGMADWHASGRIVVVAFVMAFLGFCVSWIGTSVRLEKKDQAQKTKELTGRLTSAENVLNGLKTASDRRTKPADPPPMNRR